MKNTSYPIHRWPEKERPRERLLQWGPEALAESELLALLIRTGSARHSALEVAKQVLSRVEAAGGWEKFDGPGQVRPLPHPSQEFHARRIQG